MDRTFAMDVPYFWDPTIPGACQIAATISLCYIVEGFGTQLMYICPTFTLWAAGQLGQTVQGRTTTALSSEFQFAAML